METDLQTKVAAVRLDSRQPDEYANQLSLPVNRIRGHIEAHKDTVFCASNTVAQGGLLRSILQVSRSTCRTCHSFPEKTSDGIVPHSLAFSGAKKRHKMPRSPYTTAFAKSFVSGSANMTFVFS